MPIYIHLKQIRPDVLLIGTSTFDRSYEFQTMGIQHFLLKPYLINDLLDIVAGEKNMPG